MTHYFPEDPAENARLCLELAPRHCHRCSNYHLGAIMRRATLPRNKKIADQSDFVKAISEALLPLLGSAKPAKVVIAGTTDTGLYTDVLNAAIKVGGPDFARSLSLTIVDRCQTPLTICGRFAEKHGLPPQLHCLDFIDFRPAQSVDLVLLHGVLSFFPKAERLATLDHMRSWLTTRGVMICSTQMGRRSGADETVKRTAHATANLEQFMTAHGMNNVQQRNDLRIRLASGMDARNRHADLFANEEEALRFYGDAGFAVDSLTWIDNEKRSVQGLQRRYSARAIATCRSAEPG